MFTVLYVDDEPALLELAKVFLERSSEFSIVPKLTADEGLEFLKQSHCDAVISDYQMPGKDGIEFLQEVRAGHGNIPFILFTGKGREEVIIQAINNGVDFYLQKGGDPTAQFAELSHKIRTAVQRRCAERFLKESEQRQADIINFLPDATFAIDARGKIIAWNRAMEEMSGIKKEDMLGKGNYEYGLPFYGERRPLLIDLVLTKDGEIEKRYPAIQRKGDSLISEMFVPAIYQGRGAYLWFIASPLYNTEGRIIGAIEGIRDVSDRKTIELSLSESEQRYRAVVEDQTEFICRFSPDGMHSFVNEAYCRYFGKIREEIVGKKFTPPIPAEDLPLVRNHFAALTRDNPTATVIHRIIMDNGEIRWHRWSDRAIFDRNGAIIEYQSVGRDITRQKLVELELAMNKDYLDRIFTSVKAGIVVIDAKTHAIIDLNPAAEEMIGSSKEQILGQTCHRYICPAEWGKCPITDQGLTVDNSERVLLMADGRKKSIIKYVTRTTLRGRDVLLETFIDNTQRKKTEEELQAAYFQLSAAERELQQKYEELFRNGESLSASEKAYRTIFENTGTAMLIVDEDRTISLINSKAEELSGYTKDEIEGKRKWTEFIEKDDLQKMIAYNNERWKSGDTIPSQYEFRFLSKNAGIKQVFLTIGIIPGTKESVASLIDVTGFKVVLEALRKSEERLRLVMNGVSIMIGYLDAGMNFVYANKSLADWYGETETDLVGKSLRDLITEESSSLVEPYFEQAMTGREVMVECRTRSRDGRDHVLIIDLMPHLHNGRCTGFFVTLDDVTDRKHAEAALQDVVRSAIQTSGKKALHQIAGILSSWLGADCVMIGEIQPDGETVNVVSMVLEGKIIPDFTYKLRGTPCENVKDKGFCLYPDHAAELFPKSKDLVDLDIRGYVGTPLRNSDGQVVGILCALFRNPIKDSTRLQEIIHITFVRAAAEIERKRVEEELQSAEERFRNLMDHIPGISIQGYRADGTVVYWNKASETVYGYTAPEAIGKKLGDLIIPAPLKPLFGECLLMAKTVRTSGEFMPSGELVLQRKNGSMVTVYSIHTAVCIEGMEPLFFCIDVDLSERKRVEDALSLANRKLNLLNSVTRHDILNKLMALRGNLELAQDPLDEHPDQTKYLKNARDAASVIEELISFTREYQDLGMSSFVWQNVNDLVRKATKSLNLGSVEVIFDRNDVEIFSDPLMQKIWYNLLDNSLRHGGKVTKIQITSSESEKNLVLIYADDGIGIPVKLKEKIFKPGYGKNTGYGLFFIREILGLSGITITEDGIPGTGARFVMTVPKDVFRISTVKPTPE